MYVVFFAPLLLSVVAAAMVLVGEFGPVTKGVVLLLTAAAALIQFVPSLRESVHFLVPLFMQLFVCGWWYFASLMEGF